MLFFQNVLIFIYITKEYESGTIYINSIVYWINAFGFTTKKTTFYLICFFFSNFKLQIFKTKIQLSIEEILFNIVKISYDKSCIKLKGLRT